MGLRFKLQDELDKKDEQLQNLPNRLIYKDHKGLKA